MEEKSCCHGNYKQRILQTMRVVESRYIYALNCRREWGNGDKLDLQFELVRLKHPPDSLEAHFFRSMKKIYLAKTVLVTALYCTGDRLES